jgi:sterol desaturase/sphingolipid hydroxylase (fatty acid hydroxylase superfamily)
MSQWLTGHEPVLRLAAFAGVLLLLVSWEQLSPRRLLRLPKARRWLVHLSLAGLDTLLLRLLFPAAAVGAARFAAQRGWGLLQLLELPELLAIAISIVLLDLGIYLQHVMFHALPVLWRVHRVHHADLDFDASTGLRFHPLEILISMSIKLALVLLIGAPAFAVLLFELLLNATSMFNHSNVRLPLRADRLLRWVLVTPDMHRVHHSIVPSETNSNFGFHLPWWDRLFGTYRAQPRGGHEAMPIGLRQYQQPVPRGLLWLLRLPWQSDADA